MGANASLEMTDLTVEPGGEVSAALRVRNVGSVVDEFTFEIIGDAAGWASAEPAILRLLPDGEEYTHIVFRPARSHEVTAGSIPFGVKVLSREDPAGTVVEEGTITVVPFADITAELVPRTVRGRRRARQELAVDNRGNERFNADVIAYDDDELLDFVVRDPAVVAEPGTASFTRLLVEPRKRFWRGPNKTVPFNVQLQSTDAPPVTVQGSMLQEALLPPWFAKALLALLALLLLLVAFWQFLLKPSIESAAREAVEEDLAAIEEGMAEQAAASEELQAAVASLDEQLASAAGVPDFEPPPAPADDEDETGDGDADGSDVTPTPTTQQPRDLRLTASANPGQTTTSSSFTVGEGETFELVDVVLQNPRGNEGEVRVRRGTQVLLAVALENFRDLDYHFVAPIVFAEGDELNLQLVCREVVEGESQCSAAGYFSGTVTTVVEDEEAG